MAFSRALPLIGLSLLSVALLAGCSSAEPFDGGEAPAVQQSRSTNYTDNLSSDPTTFFSTLPNGAKVLCVAVNYQTGYGSASNFSCDWTNAQGLNIPAPGK